MANLQRFFFELRRRRVFRVALVYCVIAWAVVEIGDVVVEPLRLPEWTLTLLIVLVALGLPVALVLAWAFDVTPDGVKRTASSGGGDTPPAPGSRSGPLLHRSAWFLAGMLVVTSAAWMLLERPPPPTPVDLDPSAIAVLPFRTAGADPQLSYLGEGMLDLLAAKLNGDVGPRALDPPKVLSRLRGRRSMQHDLPLDSAVELARELGAGQLLTGSVVGSPSLLTLNATVVDAAFGGSTEASASGPVDSLPALVDRLVATLLSLESGEAEHRLGSLTSTSFPALRGYLEGRSLYRRGLYRDAAGAFHRALQVDSGFALAGIGLSEAAAMGTGPGMPSGSRGLELAWLARERLSSADREYLEFRRGPPYRTSERERVHRWEQATARLPDRAEVWYELGDRLLHGGAVAGIPDHLERAAAAFDRAVALDSALFVALQHRYWVAVARQDTAGVRRLTSLLRSRAPGGFSDFQLQWNDASFAGDTARLATLRAAIDTAGRDLLVVLHNAVYWDDSPMPGVTTPDAERTLELLERSARTSAERWQAARLAHAFALNRGRPSEARRLTERHIGLQPDPTHHLRRMILDALYWDGDTAAASRAAAELERSVGGSLAPVGDRRDEYFRGLCTLEQWRLWRGNAASAGRTVAELSGTADSTRIGIHNAVCATLLEALAAAAAGRAEASARVLALDSLLRTGPPVDELREQANIVAARLLESQGDLEGALAATRRRILNFGMERYLAPTLREEARLAARTGDREGAIKAYHRYLNLRSDPEPALQARVQEVREELESLLSEQG